MRHKHRELSVAEDVIGHTSGQRLAEWALRISAHHEEIGPKRLRLAEDNLAQAALTALCLNQFRLDTVPARFLRERTWRPRIRVRDRVYDEGGECIEVRTAAGQWLFHKRGGGFSSLVDKDGNDWIGYHPRGGPDGEYRGIPNLVHPEGYFHPGGNKCVSALAVLGPLRAAIDTRSADGRWRCRWTGRGDGQGRRYRVGRIAVSGPEGER